MKTILPILIALALVACNRRAQNETAVREAIERYLTSRPNLNMQSMNLRVRSIQVRDEKADAEVTFSARNDAAASMSMHYKLRRRGGTWEVEPQSGAHGGMTPPAGSSELPPGHPPVKEK